MTDLIYTHVTMRVPGPEHHFLINPYGLMFDEVTASNLVKIGLDGRLVEKSDALINMAGFVIHGAIHGAREDAKCIVHTHTRAGCAVAALRDGLQPINQIALEFYNQVAYHDYEGISYHLDEQQRLVKHLADKPVMILRNHGLLTVGSSVSQAFLRMYYLEKACDIQLSAMSSGAPLTLPSTAICERAAAQYSTPPAAPNPQLVADPDGINLAWQALLRMLDRLDPSYRQ